MRILIAVFCFIIIYSAQSVVYKKFWKKKDWDWNCFLQKIIWKLAARPILQRLLQIKKKASADCASYKIFNLQNPSV